MWHEEFGRHWWVDDDGSVYDEAGEIVYEDEYAAARAEFEIKALEHEGKAITPELASVLIDLHVETGRSVRDNFAKLGINGLDEHVTNETTLGIEDYTRQGPREPSGQVGGEDSEVFAPELRRQAMAAVMNSDAETERETNEARELAELDEGTE